MGVKSHKNPNLANCGSHRFHRSHRIALVDVKSHKNPNLVDCGSHRSHRIALVGVKSHRIPTWWIVAHTDLTDLTRLPKWALNPTLNRTDCECATK